MLPFNGVLVVIVGVVVVEGAVDGEARAREVEADGGAVGALGPSCDPVRAFRV
jgi:hypothetical protein